VYKLIIAGGRDFHDWRLFYSTLYQWLDDNDPNETNTTIYTGLADGADNMGMLFAQDRGIPYDEFPADWNYGKGAGDGYSKVAGKRRNQQMASTATHLIAFWNGVSTGTKDMISRATQHNLNIIVQRYDQPKKVNTLW